tara:strand:- start:538 stop:657 length:120 start_codon:yes stop_codon:yes gene_type:complete
LLEIKDIKMPINNSYKRKSSLPRIRRPAYPKIYFNNLNG